MRLNKFLSDAGVCSRRQADQAILDGLVFVSGKRANLGDQVTGDEEITFRGKRVSARTNDYVILAYNKPKGVECTADPKVKNNIVSKVGYKSRVYPVGRLDLNSRGLILLTDNGELANELTKASNRHEKEYLVRVDKPLTESFIEKMSKGVYLKDLDKTTAPCKVSMCSKFTFSIVLVQGLNRQIRRMCNTFGYNVTDLQRIRIMDLELGDLAPGSYREIDGRVLGLNKTN